MPLDHDAEILLEMIRAANRPAFETVGVNQSILGRILGYGTVIVRGTGGSFEPVSFIGDPLTFRSTITAG